MIHLLIPMSGQGTRYLKAGYHQPKPAIPVNGIPMIKRLMTCFPENWPTVFVMAENHKQSELPDLLTQLRPEATQDFIPIHTEGPIKAIEDGLQFIPDHEPVLISYCDYGMIWDAEQFQKFVRETDCDACLISYRGFHAHYLSPTTYAYSRLDGELVREVKEKGSFTSNRENEFASSGAYYFKSSKILKEALAFQRKTQLHLNGEYYTSLTVEALLRLHSKAKVRIFEIPYFFQWGTPQDLWNFEYWEKTFSHYNHTNAQSPGQVSQVLMPMAGLGSRFHHLTQTPKPFIKIQGTEMFRKALGSLPQGKTFFVGLKQFLYNLNSDEKAILLEKTPEGQALTTQVGVSTLDQSKDVLVSSCDHSIVLEAKKWQKFVQNPQCDAAIFTITGYPGSSRNPKAYAYVELNKSDKTEYREVTNVSVKQPMSDNPHKDALLVGTFWFQKASALDKVIKELVEKNIRVNNELYLDSVFNLLIKNGLTVREIPLDGYINWGDPDSLAEAQYWYEVFCGQRLLPRQRFSIQQESI